MSVTTTSLGELLKRLYASWEIEQLVNLTYPTLGECAAKGNAQLGGSGFYFPIRVESAEGHAYIDESDDLPVGRNSTVLQATVAPKVHAGVVQLTGLSMAVSSGNASAFARAFDENVQQTIEAMSAYKEGAFFRDGTGILSTVVSGAGSTSITVADAAFFREGMRISVFDKTTEGTTDTWLHGSGGAAAVLKVTAVNWVTNVITVDANLSGSAASGDEIYISGGQSETTGTPPTDKEPIGLEGSLLNSGSYLGQSRANYSNWQANVQAESGFLDEDILLRARTRITQESGKPFTSMAGSFKLLTHPQQVDVLFKLAVPRIQFSGGNNLDLGNATNVSFGGIPTVTSYLCPTSTAYLGDWRYSQSLYTPGGELHVDTEYNGSALKWVATKDQGLVFLKEYHAFAVKAPVCFSRITGLSTPTR